MAYDENFALRISQKLAKLNIPFVEKKMFGGIAFMIDDKMCVGVSKQQMMLRVLDEDYDTLIEENYVYPMQFTGKTMRGFLFIDQEAFRDEKEFERFILFGLEFGEKGVVKSKKNKKKVM
ncbi:MAG: TfoX/Sxy family protein [Bacteroidota bacterium]